MSHAAVLLLSLVGFGGLALAMIRHQEAVFGHRLAPRATLGLRLAGWVALALATGVAVRAQGWALGLVSISGHTSLAAAVVLTALIVHDRARDVRRRPSAAGRGAPERRSDRPLPSR